MWIKIIWLCFGFFCLKNDINCVQQKDPIEKCLPKSVIFGMLPKLFTEMLNGRQYLLVDTTFVCILNSILLFDSNKEIHEWLILLFDSARTHQTHLDLWNFVNEDYIAGYTQDGQMSTVRRFFLLFVAFDLFFISMLWFICIMVNEFILI